MNHAKLASALIASFLLVSCGGGDGGVGGGTPGGSPTPLTGVFIDSPVQGLPYSTTSGLSGQTGANGEFQYRSGDRITFGSGLFFLEGLAQPYITPFTLLGRTSVADVQHIWPVNLARYLLGLNTTPTADSITLPAAIPPLPLSTSFSDNNFDAAVTAANIPLASQADAIAHLKRQFAIWGSWAAVSPNGIQVFTFLPNGIYLLADDDDPTVAGGNDGMERGTYGWNPNTNVLTFTVDVDTDGTGGLSNPGAPPYLFVIGASGNSAVLHLGPNVSDQIHLSRVIDAANPIVGTWALTVPVDLGFPAVITFLPDGTFTVASDEIQTIPAGIERGSYTLNNQTLNLMTIVDTNGEFGFNELFPLPGNSTEQALLSSSLTPDLDFLELRNGNDIAFFHRIKVP